MQTWSICFQKYVRIMGRRLTQMNTDTRNKICVHLCLSVFFIIFLALSAPQVVYAQSTPTPIPDGAVPITVEVQPNDSLWAIAVPAGLTLQELLDLNGLTEDALIQPGQVLIIGYTMPEPTPTIEVIPTETATLPPPPPTQTAVPPPPTGVCLTAFTDRNGNGIQDAGETLKTAVAFTIFNEEMVVANYVTDGVSEPYCLNNLAEGEYHITRSVGPDEVLTTPGNRGIIVRLGAVADLTFGSVAEGEMVVDEVGAETAVPISAPGFVAAETAVPNLSTAAEKGFEESNRSTNRNIIFVGIIIALILLVGSVFFIIRIRNK